MRVASVLVVLLAAAPVAAEVEDYLLIFAAERPSYRPDKAHTFAALVRVETAANCPPRVVELTSLSWLPAAGKVRALAMRPEKGRNVPLHETLRVAAESGYRIHLWGPYRVTPELAETFKARVATVEASYQYKAACLLAPRRVCDCARSLEEMTVSRRRYIGVCGYGAAASSAIVRNLAPQMIEPEQSHPWVEALIGLDEYPILHRAFGEYTSRRDRLRALVGR